jgi:hypothetical protein
MRPIKFKYYVLLITFFNILYWANCAAQESDNKKIDQIRQWYMEINKNRDSFTKVVDNDINVYKDLNPQKYSFESTEIYRLALINLERWFSDRKLVKAIVTFDGDSEDLTSEYYFHDQRLFFVFKKKIEYHKPKWDKKFDPNKKTVLENRFYFDNNKLIRWVDSSKKMRKATDAEFKTIEHQILSDASLYREIEHKK